LSSEKHPDISSEPVCLVERLHSKDDIDHLSAWKRRLNKLTPLFSLIAVASYWVYFAFRIKYTVAAQRAANRIFAMAWTFIAVEMGVACKYNLIAIQ
jgi:hypothetical protein